MKNKSKETRLRYAALIGLCDATRSIIIARKQSLAYGESEAASKGLIAAQTVLEDQILQYLEQQACKGEDIHQIVLTSFSAALVDSLPLQISGSYGMSDRDWLLFMSHMEPIDLKIMASRGLGMCGQQRSIYKMLETRIEDPFRACGFAAALAEYIGRQELAQSNTGRFFMYSDDFTSIDSPYFAPYVRAQVECFAQDVDVFSRASNFETTLKSVLIAILAGAPASTFAEANQGPDLKSRIIRLLNSNHGRLQVHAITGTLEEFLADAQYRLIKIHTL